MTTEEAPHLTTHTTTCPLDCPDACSLEVKLDGTRLHSIDGSPADSFTDGYICGKVRRFADHFYCDDRLLRPAKRVGPKGASEFQTVSWDEAYDLIARRVAAARDEYGGESIVPLCYGGSNGKLTQDTVDMRFFYRLGASHLDRTVCAAPSSAAFNALYGKMPGVALSDYAHSKLIIIWGNNPHASGIHLVRYVLDAKKKGAKLVVIDPRETQFAKLADLHIPLFPGTDLPVALAMIRWLANQGHVDQEFLEQHTSGAERLLERAEAWTIERAAETAAVSQKSLEQLFTWYAETSPAVIRCGWGPERNRNGGSAIAAILAIPAMANKFCRGGGFTMSNSGAWQLPKDSAINAPPPATRHINMNQIGQLLLSSEGTPIQALFVYNCNPVATLPEQNKVEKGLEREDLFTVVFDQVLTDTAKYADILLPATTFLEHRDLRTGYGYARMAEVQPVLAAEGEAKPNYEVFAELLRRLDLEHEDDVSNPVELQAVYLGNQNQQLADQGQLQPPGGPCPIQMQDVFPRTASGKIELFPEALEAESSVGLYQYLPDGESDADGKSEFPLALISPATSQTVNSTFGQLMNKPAVLRMHPTDANDRELTSGQPVRVFNERGEVYLDVQVDPVVRPGVVEIPKGIWARSTANGKTSNALSPDTLSDIGAGACFNDARVQVVAAS